MIALRSDLAVDAWVPFEATPWVPSPEPSVQRKMLARDGDEVARATSIVRYARGSAFPPHVHARGEEVVVLEGTFSDEHGDYPAGVYVRSPPGSRHRPFSSGGCIIFVKLRQLDFSDARRCVIQLDDAATSPLLHTFGGERVSALRLGAGESTTVDAERGGAELLVVRGAMIADARSCAAWTWVRAARGSIRVRSPAGCLLWVKQGHLDGAPHR